MPELSSGLSYLAFFLVFASIFAIMALGLNLQWGFTGLFNVGVAGFVGIGAYASALLTAPDDPDPDRRLRPAGPRRLARRDRRGRARRPCRRRSRRCGCATTISRSPPSASPSPSSSSR